jgi:toluene monooxygenase system ferredoxin subunit
VVNKVFVCKKADIPPNGMKECSSNLGQRVLVLDAGGTYFACQPDCPHQRVSLCEGFYDGETLTCYQHLWQWEIRTGAAVGPAEAPLQFYEIIVEGDSIYLKDAGTLIEG